MLQGVRFEEPQAGCLPLAELPPPIRRHAVPVADEGPDFEVLSIPSEHADGAEQAEQVRRWAAPAGATGYQLVSIHGAQVHWCPPRLAVIAWPDDLDPVRRAVLEMAYLEAELRAAESGLADLWPELEADAPRAFEFRERDLAGRQRLAQRFVRVLLLRARLAKVVPRLLLPQAYPPTLPAQVQDRLRERLGVFHRAESLQTQLEAFERVYEGCAQRASEYLLARKSMALEWVIILLLALQTVLTFIELVSGVKG